MKLYIHTPPGMKHDLYSTYLPKHGKKWLPLKGIFVRSVQSAYRTVGAVSHPRLQIFHQSFCFHLSLSSVSMPLEYDKLADSTPTRGTKWEGLTVQYRGQSVTPPPSINQNLSWCIKVLFRRISDLNVHSYTPLSQQQINDMSVWHSQHSPFKLGGKKLGCYVSPLPNIHATCYMHSIYLLNLLF